MAVDPASDPQFLAFQRALGMDDAEIQALTAYRKEQTQLGLASRMPDYARQIEVGNQGISDDYEARGVHSSGQRVQRQNENTSDVQRKVFQDQLGVNSQMGDLDLELAKQIAANRRASADQYLTSSANAATGAAKGVLNPLIQGA